MSTNANPSIVSKIQKLLSKTEGRGCTPEEAKAAFAMASRLLAEHNLNIEELGASKPNESWTEIEVGYFPQWRKESDLAWDIVTDYYFVESLFKTHNCHRGRRLYFLGLKENTETAYFVFHSLLRAFKYLWEDYKATEYCSAYERRGFIEYVAKGFSDKLRLEREKMVLARDVSNGRSGSTALALSSVMEKTKTEFRRRYPRTTTATTNIRDTFASPSTMQAGYQAGRNLNLGK